MDFDAQQIAAQELEPGEKLLWAGRPAPGRMARGALPTVLGGFLWTAFVVFWIFRAAGEKLPDFSRSWPSLFPLFGVPFLLVGLGMLGAPLWAYLKASRTVYAVTDKRALIIATGLGISRAVTSVTPGDLGDVERVERSDGSGDLLFGAQALPVRRGMLGYRTQRIGFLGIPAVRTVEQLVLDALKKPRELGR